jgi:IPT/TIG domain
MPPVVNSVTPSRGAPSGGTTVTITGTGFSGAAAVRFGSRLAASFTVGSATRITAVTPAGTGTVRVTVTTSEGTSTQNVTFSYVTAAVPVLTGVVPGSGPTSGGTTVTLTGTDLSGVTAVSFGSTPAASFTVGSDTRITAVSPAGSAGAVAVTVTSPGGTSPVSPSAFFFYAAPPTLTGITPVLGPSAGGITVTLTGTNLLNATAVLFGSTPATALTAVSSTQITATAPAGAGTAQVTVVTPGGTSDPVAFTYLAAPTLTSVVPDNGPVFAGTVVTLTGTGFSTATAVQFGTVLVSFTAASDTQIAATAPAGPTGTVPVTITTPGGTSNSFPYTRVGPPGI